MLSKAGIRELQRYRRKKYRVEDGRLLVEGWRSLEAAAEAGASFDWLFVAEEADETALPDNLIARLTALADRTDRLTPSEMKAIASSVTPPDLTALIAWRPMETNGLVRAISAGLTGDGRSGTNPAIVLIVDGVSDPGNLGSIIRTADWFGARGVFTGPGSVELTNPKVVQSTMGSLFQLPVGAGDSIPAFVDRLKAFGYSVVSLELDGAVDAREADWPERLVVVVGNEARGISDETRVVADRRVRIPRFGRAESLNAGASVAAILGLVCLSREGD
jgi:TrmH family RNA methyltransferase